VIVLCYEQTRLDKFRAGAGPVRQARLPIKDVLGLLLFCVVQAIPLSILLCVVLIFVNLPVNLLVKLLVNSPKLPK